MSEPPSASPLSIVLPTYNERHNVVPLIARLSRSIEPRPELLVVDDDSPDGTGAKVEELALGLRHLRVIRRTTERGLTSAIQRGIDESTGEIIVWMDCDLSMPPETVPELVRNVRELNADAAVGSRFVPGGSCATGNLDPALVRLQRSLTRGLNRLAFSVLSGSLRDWTSGFIAVRASVVKPLRLRGEYGEYFIVLMAELLAGGARIVEVPYRCAPRESGESKTARSPFGLFRLGPRYLRAVLEARRSLRGIERPAGF